MHSPRRTNLFAFIFCLILLATAFYFEFIVGLMPCPLCIAQRIVFIYLAIIFLLATLHNPKQTGMRVYSILGLGVSLMGTGLAARQVWLELNPPSVTDACMPGLHYMLQHLPLTQTLKIMLTGSGECAQVNWTFLGLSMAGWALVMFAIFILISMRQLYLAWIS